MSRNKSSTAKKVGRVLNLLSLIAPKFASQKAMQLFITPRKGRPSDMQLKFLSNSEVSSLVYENLEIKCYHWRGDGPTVLLAHGWESNSGRWAYLLPELQALDCNVVALDAPAHGQSGSQYFNALLYAEFINKVANTYNPAVIIGHSVGGMASIFFQHKYPSGWLKKIALLGAPSEFEMIFKQYVEMMGYNSRIAQGLDDIVISRFGKRPGDFSGAHHAKSFQGQLTVIHDKDDKVIPFDQALMYKELNPEAKLISTQGNGHGLKNKEVTTHLIDFISSEYE